MLPQFKRAVHHSGAVLRRATSTDSPSSDSLSSDPSSSDDERPAVKRRLRGIVAQSVRSYSLEASLSSLQDADKRKRSSSASTSDDEEADRRRLLLGTDVYTSTKSAVR